MDWKLVDYADFWKAARMNGMLVDKLEFLKDERMVVLTVEMLETELEIQKVDRKVALKV
jgi:hypothetical protein